MIVPTDDFPARLSACARSPASAGARRPASVSVSTAVMNLLLSVLRYGKTLLFGRVRDVMCVALPHRQGWILGYTNQLADGEIIIRTICSRATMVSLIASLLSAYPFALLCAGARLPRRRVGLEPTPWPATERTRCPYSEIFESGQRDIMRHFCFQCIDITSHIAQWHHGCAQLGRRTPSPYTTLVPCPMNPTAHL